MASVVSRFGVPATFAELARVERVEAMCYAALVADAWIRNRHRVAPYDSTLEFHEMCIRVGCLSQNDPDVRERWRKLHALRHWAALPVVLVFEDRPRCKICNGPVATGHARKNCHDECLRYAHLILLPAVRVAQAEKLARENAASEVDR